MEIHILGKLTIISNSFFVGTFENIENWRKIINICLGYGANGN